MDAVGVILLGTILFLESYTLWESRKKGTCMDLSVLSQRWRIPLVLATFISFILMILDGTLTWHQWLGQDVSCAAIQIPHILLYCLAKQFMYLFLYERAKIVHDSLQLTTRNAWRLHLFRNLVWLTIVAGVPVIFYWSAFVAFDGKVTVDGYCLFYSIYPEVIVAFAASDFVLASSVFVLFVFPLYTHVRQMEQRSGTGNGNGHNSARFRRVMWHNLEFSCAAMLSAFLCLNAEAVLMCLGRDNGTVNGYYLIEWGLVAVSIDNCLGIMLLHCMTTAWMPRTIRSRLGFTRGGGGGGGGGSSSRFTSKQQRLAAPSVATERGRRSEMLSSALVVVVVTSDLEASIDPTL